MIKNTKQVIVVRKFPNLRTGKYCSQVAHAAMAFLTKQGNMAHELIDDVGWGSEWSQYFRNGSCDMVNHFNEIDHWLKNSFRKITVYVNSQQELEDIHQKAIDAGLMSHLITDNGATEFNQVPTKTCCAIGPHFDDKFIGITDNLPLL